MVAAQTWALAGDFGPVRYFLCIPAYILAAAAFAALGWSAALSGPAGILEHPLGQLWFKLHVGSLNLVQAVIERYIWPPIWDPAIVSLLQLPAVTVFAVPALILMLLCHLRRR